MPTSLANSPVAPLPKNQDDKDVLKRAIDKRPKKVPIARAMAVRTPKPRAFAGRPAGR